MSGKGEGVGCLVFLPTYNESENIIPLLERLTEVKGIDILVVDDSSPDNTAGIVAEFASSNRRVKLIVRKGRRGRGRAGMAAYKFFLKHEYRLFVEMDADFSHDPGYVPVIIEHLKKHDVVVGSRMVKGGKDCERGLCRRLLSITANRMTRVLLGLPVRDCNSGFRGFRRAVIEGLAEDCFSGISSASQPIIQETMLKVFSKGFKIKEIPIEFRQRREGVSKLRPEHLFIGFFAILKLWLARHGFAERKK